MLHQSRLQAQQYGGQGRFWKRPYAEARPLAASAIAPVWVTTYPASIITPPGESVLATLGDARLWQVLSPIGIRALHAGPTKLSGGIKDGAIRRRSTEISTASASTPTRSSARRRSSSPSAAWPRRTTRWSSTTSFPRTPARARTSASPRCGHSRLSGPLPHGGDRRGRLGAPARGAGGPGRGEPAAGDRRPAARQGLHHRAAAAGDLLRAGRQGDRLERHRAGQGRRRQGAALGLSPLLQGGAAEPQLARPFVRGASR